MKDYKDEQLIRWLDMVTCRSMLQDREMLLSCFNGLNDKTIVYDISLNASLSNSYPLPTRVCDHCMMALLYYSRADVHDVFEKHGLKKLKHSDYASMNIKMFDDVIKNRHKYYDLD